MSKGFLTVREIAAALKASVWQVRRAIRDNGADMPAKVSGRYVVSAEQVPRLFELVRARQSRRGRPRKGVSDATEA